MSMQSEKVSVGPMVLIVLAFVLLIVLAVGVIAAFTGGLS